jgi:hypothetical protein
LPYIPHYTPSRIFPPFHTYPSNKIFSVGLSDLPKVINISVLLAIEICSITLSMSTIMSG